MQISRGVTADAAAVPVLSTERTLWTLWTLWILGLALAAMGLGMVLLRDIETAVAFAAIDDGLYYPVIARNFLERGRMTFDGVTSTNGFHPLWMVFVIPLCAISKNPAVALWLVFALALVLTVVAFYFFALACLRLRLSAGGIALAFFVIFANFRSFTTLLSTIEAPVVLAAYTAYVYYALRVGDRRFTAPVPALVTGLLIGVAFLSRTDSVFLCVGYGAVLLWKVARRQVAFGTALRAGAAAAVGVLAFAVPYCTLNYVSFGHILTVSGSRKIVSFSLMRTLALPMEMLDHTLIPRIVWVFGLPAWSHTALLWVIPIVSLIALVAMVFWLRRPLVAAFTGFPEFPLFAAMHFFWVWLFMPGEAFLSSWYYMSELLVMGIGLAAVIPSGGRADRVTLGVMAAALLVQAAAYPRFVRNKTMSWAKFEVARFVRNQLPPTARLGMFDAGITSYFSGRDYLVLGGLVGDFEQSELTRRNEIGEIARRYHMTHLVLDILLHPETPPPAKIVFQGTIETKFTNFSEGLKRFTVFEGTPDELDDLWRWRLHFPPRPHPAAVTRAQN